LRADQYIEELRKLPMAPKMRAEFQEGFPNANAWSELATTLNEKSATERYNNFTFIHLLCYQSFIDELGYLPSELIMGVVNACAGGIRNISQLDEYGRECPYNLISNICKIGEGIAAAATLDKVMHYELSVRTYSKHGFVQGLSSEATAGDCFLFNAMFQATGRPPFKDAEISTALKYYFQIVNQMYKDDGNDSNVTAISMALSMTVTNIFGKKNSGVSAPAKKGIFGWLSSKLS